MKNGGVEMTEHASVKKIWAAFLSSMEVAVDGVNKYEAYSFGNDEDTANQLAALVMAGKKRGTSSLYALYEIEDEELPAVNDYSIILNWAGEAQCIIQNTNVFLLPFNEVTPEFAKQEGEGDLSLDYWKRVHRKFFVDALKEIGKEFSEEMLVVCEVFEVVYSAD